MLAKYPISSVLEVGCNIGANLRWICKSVLPHRIVGIDINKSALERLQQAMPEIHVACAPARELPFRDNAFSLVSTAGLLIHQPECALPLVMGEIVRCSNRYVLCMEYFAETQTEIPYRGLKGALFKRPYGYLYQEMFPELILLEHGALSRNEGWDDISFWMFRKQD
jgi:pseudaminic acid biosynthesis-associated methylase